MVPALEEEIASLQNELISEREFQKIQNQMESRFVQSNSTMARIAESWLITIPIMVMLTHQHRVEHTAL